MCETLTVTKHAIIYFNNLQIYNLHFLSVVKITQENHVSECNSRRDFAFILQQCNLILAPPNIKYLSFPKCIQYGNALSVS